MDKGGIWNHSRKGKPSKDLYPDDRRPALEEMPKPAKLQ
jgi:hypothetical protein